MMRELVGAPDQRLRGTSTHHTRRPFTLVTSDQALSSITPAVRVHALLMLPPQMPMEVEWRVAAQFMLRWQMEYLQAIGAEVTLVCGEEAHADAWKTLVDSHTTESVRLVATIEQFDTLRLVEPDTATDVVLLMAAPCFTDLLLEEALTTHRCQQHEVTLIHSRNAHRSPYACIMNTQYASANWERMTASFSTTAFSSVFGRQDMTWHGIRAGHVFYLRSGRPEEVKAASKFWDRRIMRSAWDGQYPLAMSRPIPVLPRSVKTRGPLLIGEGVTIGAGTSLGPWVVLETGVTVGEACWIEHAHIGAQASLASEACVYQAIVSPGAHVQSEKPVLKGCLEAGAEGVFVLPSLGARHVLPRWQRACKRAADILLAGIGLVVLLPLLLLISGLCLVAQGWPVMFLHERLSAHGRTFRVFKFRTMRRETHQDASVIQALHRSKRFKIRNDPRVTVVGRILRKTSLDELPQILNVLIGTMSVVGPRPIVSRESERYGTYITDLLRVKPGVTGLWQVSGRTNTTYQRRVMLDAKYADTCSLWGDTQILLKTIPTVLLLRGSE